MSNSTLQIAGRLILGGLNNINNKTHSTFTFGKNIIIDEK